MKELGLAVVITRTSVEQTWHAIEEGLTLALKRSACLIPMCDNRAWLRCLNEEEEIRLYCNGRFILPYQKPINVEKWSRVVEWTNRKVACRNRWNDMRFVRAARLKLAGNGDGFVPECISVSVTGGTIQILIHGLTDGAINIGVKFPTKEMVDRRSGESYKQAVTRGIREKEIQIRSLTRGSKTNVKGVTSDASNKRDTLPITSDNREMVAGLGCAFVERNKGVAQCNLQKDTLVIHDTKGKEKVIVYGSESSMSD